MSFCFAFIYLLRTKARAGWRLHMTFDMMSSLPRAVFAAARDALAARSLCTYASLVDETLHVVLSCRPFVVVLPFTIVFFSCIHDAAALVFCTQLTSYTVRLLAGLDILLVVVKDKQLLVFR